MTEIKYSDGLGITSGKMLIIDDQFEDIKELINEFLRKGFPITYWNPKTINKPNLDNVRVILTDINISGAEPVTRQNYDELAELLSGITGPFLLMFVSVNFDEDDSVEMMKESYHDVNGKNIPGIVMGVNFDKKQTSEVIEEMTKKLDDVITAQNLFQTLLVAEAIINQGKDRVLSELSREDFTGAVETLLNTIENDTGSSSVAREFVLVLSRLLTRSPELSPQYNQLKDMINRLQTIQVGGDTGSAHQSDGWIYYNRMFYKPDNIDSHWTGDIFKIKDEEPMKQFAILITPACDMTRDQKITYYKFCNGFVATESDLKSKEHPLYKADKSLNGDSAKAIEKYIKRNQSISLRFYPLNHFLDDAKDDSRTLIIDFQSVRSLEPSSLSTSKWEHIVRLDSPFIEDLLQKYGTYSYRLGVPTVTS